MSLMNKIRNEQLAARKVQDIVKTSILTTLIGEASMIGKNDGNRETTDLEVVKIVKKFVENNNDTISHLKQNSVSGEKLVQEIENEILSSFLPKQLTESELTDIIQRLKDTGQASNIGQYMAFLRANYDGQYDGKVASVLIKKVL